MERPLVGDVVACGAGKVAKNGSGGVSPAWVRHMPECCPQEATIPAIHRLLTAYKYLPKGRDGFPHPVYIMIR